MAGGRWRWQEQKGEAGTRKAAESGKGQAWQTAEAGPPTWPRPCSRETGAEVQAFPPARKWDS